jgi:hypothetical protein
MKKTDTWTPQSNREREINGMSFDKQGNRGINAKKKSVYIRLFDDLIKFSVNDLWNNSFYRNKFKIEYDDDGYKQSIVSTLR